MAETLEAMVVEYRLRWRAPVDLMERGGAEPEARESRFIPTVRVAGSA